MTNHPNSVFVAERLPNWIRALDEPSLSVLGNSLLLEQTLDPGKWFAAAAAFDRQLLLDRQAQRERCRQKLSALIPDFKGVMAFTEGPLRERIKQTFGEDLDVHTTSLVYVRTSSSFAGLVQQYTAVEQSLLQAALHNFEDGQVFDANAGLVAAHGYTLEYLSHEQLLLTQPQNYGDFLLDFTDLQPDAPPYPLFRYKPHARLAITPASFAQMCRELDLGQQYQDYLTQTLAAPGVAEAMLELRKADFAVLSQVALLKDQIDADDFALLERCRRGLPLSRREQPMQALRLRILATELHDVVVWVPTDDSTEPCIVWMPGDSRVPLKKYANSGEFMAELVERLRQPEYRVEFLGRVHLADRVAFNQRLGARLQDSPPSLEVTHPVWEPALLEHLHRRHLLWLSSQAQWQAIPTAQVEHLATIDRWEGYLGTGIDLLGFAAMFIPGLGPLMLPIMGAQMMNELYHGLADLAEGDKAEGWSHLAGLALNLGLMAVFHKGVQLAAEIKPFTDNLLQVEGPDGVARLWNADLRPYATDLVIEPHWRPNAAGLYEIDGTEYLPVEGKLYSTRVDELTGERMIVRPDERLGYEPKLRDGPGSAWLHPGERAQTWSPERLLRRVDPRLHSLPDSKVNELLRVANVEPDVLRQAVAEGAPLPLGLTSTLEQQATAGEINRIIGAIGAGLPISSQYALPIDDMVQLPGWPEGVVLKVFEGPEPWGTATEYGDTELPQARRVEVMREHFADARRVEAIALKAPEDDLLLRELPELTAEQRRELIQGASPQELERLQRGSVPLRMIEEGRELQRDARVSRALMGWYNPELANADSALLRARYGENFDAALADRPGIDRALGIPPRSSALLSPARAASRLGYPQQAVPAIPAQARERLAALYPTLQAGELDALQAELGLAQAQLHGWAAEREAELADWLPKLQAWRDEPTLPRADSANRQEIARLLELAWRRGTPRVVTADGLSIGHELTLDGLELDSIPPLPRDLAHIKLISLNRCRFSQPPEELLRQCPQLRHLFISETPLQVIPQATTQMAALTRLRLTRNRIIWDDTAQALIDRLPSLRELSLSHNPLGRTPELGRLLNLRGALLANAQLVDWPLAALELPQMEILQLDDNLIRDIPEQVLAPSTAALDQVLRLNRGTRLTGNPLSAETLRLVRVYRQLRAERGGDFGLGAALDGATAGAPSGLRRWLVDLPADQFVARSAQWQALIEEPQSQAFFETIEQLSTARDYRGVGYAGLQQRVWNVIGAASEHSALREQLFEQAAHPRTCGDGAAYLFSTLEVSTQVFEASLAGAGEASQASLLQLAKGLFRLDEVQKLAYAEIARRPGADEAEVILRYRTFLAEPLELPGQPKGMLYTLSAGVSNEALLQAQAQILALDGSGAMVESIAARDFWDAHLRQLPEHAQAIEALDSGLQKRMEVLTSDAAAGDISEATLLARSEKLTQERERALKRLVLQWTREILDAEVEVTEL